MENENQAVQSPVNEELEHLKSLAESAGASEEDIKAIQALENTPPVSNKKTAEKKETTTDKKEVSEEQEKKVEGEQEVEEDEDDDKPLLDDEADVLGLNKSLKGKKAKIELDEKALKFIEQRFAIKDADTFVSSAEKWRTDSQQLKKTQEQLEDIEEGLKNLPVKLAEAVNTWANGGDYEAILSRERLDFAKKFEDHNKETIVSYFSKEAFAKLQKKLNDESITEEDYEDRIDDLHSSAKLLYDQNKRNFEHQRANLIQKAEDDRKSLKESAVGSVEKLKEAFPDFKPNELQSIRQALINGDTESLFKDKNGRYTENAAKHYAFAKFGERMLRGLLDREKKKGASEALEDVVARGDKQIKNAKSTEAAGKQEAEKMVEHLSFGLNKKDPYS